MTGSGPPVPGRGRAGRTVGQAQAATLDACLEAVYRALLPDARDVVDRRLRQGLRAAYFRTPADARRVRRFVETHAEGVRATLGAVVGDPDASRLLGPDALLVLERLHADPHELRDNWPDDAPLEPLLALAGANARPYER